MLSRRAFEGPETAGFYGPTTDREALESMSSVTHTRSLMITHFFIIFRNCAYIVLKYLRRRPTRTEGCIIGFLILLSSS
jgi:hypothetical protein